MTQKEGKRERAGARSAPTVTKAEAVKELRRGLPIQPFIKANNRKAMLLVGGILEPSDSEDAAWSLMRLLNLLHTPAGINQRRLLLIYAEMFALLYTEDWDTYLTKILGVMKPKKSSKKVRSV
jgi:hypothetical protein